LPINGVVYGQAMDWRPIRFAVQATNAAGGQQ
jgi:hypothetical protein